MSWIPHMPIGRDTTCLATPNPRHSICIANALINMGDKAVMMRRVHLFIESVKLTHLVNEDEIIRPTPDIFLNAGKAHVKGNSLNTANKENRNNWQPLGL